ncbi:MAG: hypothetical protein GX600_11630 [Dehalococcoidia bacterium]|nr:hypothetical protein [Dehalococcoidia bacterium]
MTILSIDNEAAVESLHGDLWGQLDRTSPEPSAQGTDDADIRGLGEGASRRARQQLLAAGMSPHDAAEEATLFAVDAVLRLVHGHLDTILGRPAGRGST